MLTFRHRIYDANGKTLGIISVEAENPVEALLLASKASLERWPLEATRINITDEDGHGRGYEWSPDFGSK